jgi:tetratricopeptide (TPR) repeat protein
MRKIILIVTLLLMTIPLAAQQELALNFAKANLAYRDGQYTQAIADYEKIIAAGTESGAVLYNLGNSYFKNKQLGKALVSYARAQRLIPRDSDLAANVKFATAAVVARVEPTLSFTDRILLGYVRFYTVNEIVLILSILLGLLGLVHLSGLYWNWPARRVVMVVLVMFLGFFAVGLGVKMNLEKAASIIIAPTSARFEPSEKATLYFELSEGQAVRIQASEGEWLKIQRPDRKMGWVAAAAVEKI